MSFEFEPKQLKLTRFTCQELLYEFLGGRLDSEKSKAIEDYLKTCKDSQRELERLNRALDYTDLAKQVELSSEMRSALLDFEPHWKKAFWSWTVWSSRRGWRALPYIFILAALALGIFVGHPWMKTQSQVTLVEQARPTTTPAIPVAAQTPVTAALTPMIPLAQPKAHPIAAIPLQAEASAPTLDPAPEPEGWVYRAQMEVSNFTETWNSIRDTIEELDGKPANDVELVTLNKPTEADFGFSLPESKKQKLLDFLKTFGPVRFNKVHDRRKMPDGEIRIILIVKDNGKDVEESTPGVRPEGAEPSP